MLWCIKPYFYGKINTPQITLAIGRASKKHFALHNGVTKRHDRLLSLGSRGARVLPWGMIPRKTKRLTWQSRIRHVAREKWKRFLCKNDLWPATRDASADTLSPFRIIKSISLHYPEVIIHYVIMSTFKLWLIDIENKSIL